MSYLGPKNQISPKDISEYLEQDRKKRTQSLLKIRKSNNASVESFRNLRNNPYEQQKPIKRNKGHKSMVGLKSPQRRALVGLQFTEPQVNLAQSSAGEDSPARQQTQTTILEGGQVSVAPQGLGTLGSFDLDISHQGSQGSQENDQEIQVQENTLFEENLGEGTLVASSVIEDPDY